MRLPLWPLAVLCALCPRGAGAAVDPGPALLRAAGVTGGLIVHVGCGDGRFTAVLHAADGYLVHGLATSPADLAAARERFLAEGVAGKVSADLWRGGRLPYVDNLVDLLVVSPPATVGRGEALRVLVPGGKAVFVDAGGLEEVARRIVKPWPEDLDEWTHYLHGPDNNAVAHDRVVGPPRRMQWLAAPRWTRHHNTLNSVSSVVTAKGRLFYILDEASPANMNLPGRWALVARGAFNGVLLWKRSMPSWVSHRHRFRSGPPQLPRLLVAAGDRVYVPLGLGEPVSALSAATGATLTTFADTRNAEEIVLAGDTLLVLKGSQIAEQALTDAEARRQFGFPARKTLVALDADTGRTNWRWTPEGDVLPLTLAAAGGQVYLRTAGAVLCLDTVSGTERWHFDTGPREERKAISWGKHNLLVAEGVLVTNVGDRIVALSASDGKKLWDCEAGTAFHEPVDLFAITGLLWHRVGHSADPMRVPPDQREARDLHTGELKVRDTVPLYLLTAGHHFRCYRPKATERFLIMNKRGVEMVDLEGNNHSRNNWVRGTCQYGVLPANGLLYTPPNSCGCYLEAAMHGFWAYAPEAAANSPVAQWAADEQRLEEGPAFGAVDPATQPAAGAWPTYRQNPLRSNVTDTAVDVRLKEQWSTRLGGALTQPVMAGGVVVVADRDAGVVYALDGRSGAVRWKHFAGGPVDSPPTLYKGAVLFGSGDGKVTCLRLTDGALVWRFLAAPNELQSVAFDRVASPWPVSGSVLVFDDVAYACAGRSTWIDGGMVLYALDPATGEVLHRQRVKNEHPKYTEQKDTESVLVKGHLWTDYKTFTQPDESDTYSVAGGLNDVPVSDGTHLFLRHLMFGKNLEPATGHKRQLFSTSSLLDDAEHHRSGWGIGSGDHDRLAAARFKGGFSQYHLKDQQQPAPYRSDRPTGLMLTFNGDTVWGIRRTSGRGLTGPKYVLFRQGIDASSEVKGWKRDLKLRARALLKAGDRLFLAVMPTDLPEDDPHAAYDGRLGGALWVCSAGDGATLAEYPLPSPARWDGMAAADERLYLSTVDGRLRCLAGAG